MEFEEDQKKWEDLIFELVIIAGIIGLTIIIFTIINAYGFNQLDTLNKQTCEYAGIPKDQCFCKMDAWGNTMCTIKQQSNIIYTTVKETTIIHSESN